MIAIKLLAGLLLFAPLCYAAVSDFRHMIVPNWVSVAMVAGFILFAANVWPSVDLQMHLLIAGVFFGVSLVFWLAGWLGGGDVKLLGAVGLWLGDQNAVAFLFILAVLSTLMAGSLLLLRRFLQPSAKFETASGPFKPIYRAAMNNRFPYAVPIVLAALATLPRHFL